MEFGGQISLFDLDAKKFKITKPIRLIELFAGYGSQALALKYLDAIYQHWKISEWAIKSIQAYKDMHFKYVNSDYSWMDIKIVKDWLKGRISADYSNPLTDIQIDRMKDEDAYKIYSNMRNTNNLGSICKISGNDLDIVDKDEYCYIMTYSFPCQDLSLAGKGAGMTKGSGTRSGLLWEVERILDELKETDSLPQVLLMENVPQVHGEGNKEDWYAWLNKLDELGYQSYYQDMNSKNYGVAQNRERTFCISVPKGYYYEFPKPFKLEKKLKDYLENSVDEKFYLSEKALNGVLTTDFESGKLENRTDRGGVCPTICARDYKDPKLTIEYEN